MDAQPFLGRIAQALNKARLEAIMVGNAAAALHGAPVTTLDFDFMFRKTPGNLKKLKLVADHLDAVVLKPFHPVSSLYRVVNDDLGLQLDFMSELHGVKSFASLRSRARRVDFGEHYVLVAALSDIIESKRALGRAKDLAVLEILEKVLEEETKYNQEQGA